jgi:SAM-dependent methyltransferase
MPTDSPFPPTDTVRRQFGPVASAYASSDYHSSGPDLAKLVEVAALTGKERVLDIGCGAGHTAIALAPFALRVTAVDITPEMLGVAADLAARRGLTNIDFERQDATNLPYPDQRFDVVSSRVAAHHYHDVRAFVAGQPACSSRRPAPPRGHYRARGSALDTFCNAFELLRDPSHVRNWRVSEWLALMHEHALAPEISSSSTSTRSGPGSNASRPTRTVARACSRSSPGRRRRPRRFQPRRETRLVHLPIALIRATKS